MQPADVGHLALLIGVLLVLLAQALADLFFE
jgi:hypothetical protein